MSSALQRPFGRKQRQVLSHLHTMQHRCHIFSDDSKFSWVKIKPYCYLNCPYFDGLMIYVGNTHLQVNIFCSFHWTAFPFLTKTYRLICNLNRHCILYSVQCKFQITKDMSLFRSTDEAKMIRILIITYEAMAHPVTLPLRPWSSKT